MFTLPGTPVLRYGDEIGMGDDLALPERDAVRTPMQWSADPHGGFSMREKTVLPGRSPRAPTATSASTSAEQRRDPDSLLNWTERHDPHAQGVPEFGWGDFACSTRARRRAGAATAGATTPC